MSPKIELFVTEQLSFTFGPAGSLTGPKWTSCQHWHIFLPTPTHIFCKFLNFLSYQRCHLLSLTNVTDGSKSVGVGKLVKTGPIWSKLVQTGTIWSRLVQTGPDCSRLVQTGPYRLTCMFYGLIFSIIPYFMIWERTPIDPTIWAQNCQASSTWITRPCQHPWFEKFETS